MPGLDGFQVLADLDPTPLVIFSTGYDKHAIRAFEINAVDYLLKPYDRQRFAEAVRRALERSGTREEGTDRLTGALNELPADKLFADRLLVKKGRRIVPMDLSNLAKRLDRSGFVRVHRSSIINLDHLVQLEKDDMGGMVATMGNGDTVRISRRHATK